MASPRFQELPTLPSASDSDRDDAPPAMTAPSPSAPPQQQQLHQKPLHRGKSHWYSTRHVTLSVPFERGCHFQLLWLAMALIRIWCILFLSWTARLYWFIAHPYMNYYASLLGPDAVEHFRPMGVCFGFLALLHLHQLAKMGYYSFQYKRLVLGPPSRSVGPNGKWHCQRNWHKRFKSPLLFFRSFLQDANRVFFDRHGPFGVESRLFFFRMLCNELLEILSQTTQLYKASIFVSKVWMNNLYVVTTVLNGWSTPLLRVVLFHRHHVSTDAIALERLVCLTVDFVLDALSAMVIPMLIFVPYYEKFEFQSYNFQLAYLYDDIWFATMVMENQQLFAQTKWEFVWKMVPHVSIYCTLNSIRALVRQPRMVEDPTKIYCAPSSSSGSSSSSSSPSPPSAGGGAPQPPLLSGSPTALNAQASKRLQKGLSVAAIPEEEPTDHPLPTADTFPHGLRPEDLAPFFSKNYRRLLHFMNAMLFLCGLAALVLHMRAAWKATTTDVDACAAMSRPWFTAKVSCTVVRFNCHMHNTTTATNQDLDMIEPSSVSAVVFSHCTAFTMPTAITTFHNLLGVDLYNCTLTEWSTEAAITAQNHPKLTYIIFIYVNMAKLPDGIVHSELPETMTDFEISKSNLSHLPPDLHTKWRHAMSIFYVEHSQLTSFPETLFHFQIDDLSLIGNQIEILPEFGEDSPLALYSLALSYTPLVALPTAMGDTSGLGFLYLAHTKLQQLPPWVIDDVAKTATKIFVHSTPFCQAKSAQEINETYGSDAVLTCVDDGDAQQQGMYPLELMAPRRLYNESEPVVGTSAANANHGAKGVATTEE